MRLLENITGSLLLMLVFMLMFASVGGTNLVAYVWGPL